LLFLLFLVKQDQLYAYGMEWNKESIGKLSNEELKSLQRNALERSNAAVSLLCTEKIDNRRSIPKSRSSIKNLHKTRSTSRSRAFDIEMNAKLSDLGRELEKIYDFSKETALAHSRGVKRFKPHNLLAKNGKDDKVYGLIKQGKIEVARYIDYRIGDDLVHIAAIILKGDEEQPFLYLVRGPDSLIGEQEDRYLETGINPGGRWFDNFDEAVALFRYIVEQIVPMKT